MASENFVLKPRILGPDQVPKNLVIIAPDDPLTWGRVLARVPEVLIAPVDLLTCGRLLAWVPEVLIAPVDPLTWGRVLARFRRL